MADTFRPEVNALELVLGTDGRILFASESLGEALGISPARLSGQHWRDVLVSDEPSRLLLSGVLKHKRGMALPPLLFDTAWDDPCVVVGYAQPSLRDDERFVRVFVDVAYHGWSDTDLPDISQTDVIAVLAMDGPLGSTREAGADIEDLMSVVHHHLGSILREGDAMGQSRGNALPFVLRDIDSARAVDMVRALHSHLYSAIEPPGAVRARAGLARVGDYPDTIAALSAANRSLILTQLEPERDTVRVASPGDDRRLLAAIEHSAGLFSGSPPERAKIAPLKKHPREPADSPAPPIAPIETGIEGYVVDNMEGAVDQAMFLAPLDVPVAIVGPAGTGKMYVARIIHDAKRGAPGELVVIDCREFRSRAAALRRIAGELRSGVEKTLVFKSPQLMDHQVQQKLAQQIATRKLADASPPRYLADTKFIALLPDSIDTLVRREELVPALASVFAASPIRVPPIRDRKQAVLRWAHKILGQEAAQRDRVIKGFTPDAERALLAYEWPGNISEMRLFIHNALQKTDKEWLTPVDLSLYTGLDPDTSPGLPRNDSFLSLSDTEHPPVDTYQPSTLERFDHALGESVHDMLQLELNKPLGSWLEDDLVLAALERYREDVPKAAAFLHTSARNVRRWLPGIEARDQDRNASQLWQQPRTVLREWVRETSPPESSPIAMMQARLMAHVQAQAVGLASARRARIMGVSTPTYLKRLKQWQSEQTDS